MKQLFFIIIIAIITSSCRVFPTGSNIRTGTVRAIHNDTVQFYGSKKLYILRGSTMPNEKFQFTVLKNSTDTSLCVIRKL